LLADTKFDLSRTRILTGEAKYIDALNEQFDNMVAQGTEMLDREGVPEAARAFEFSIDMRYHRQNFEISIPIPAQKIDEAIIKQAIEDFHAEHKRSYGYCNEHAVIQFVSYRASAIGRIEKPEVMPETLQPDAPAPTAIETRNVLFQRQREYIETPIYNRTDFVPGQAITGPCIVEQMDTTLVVPMHWTIHVDGFRNLKIKHAASEGSN
jgi:N-methylhydantoinase A